MIFWSFFYLQVYPWIAGTALPEFKSIYDNSKNITSFLSFFGEEWRRFSLHQILQWRLNAQRIPHQCEISSLPTGPETLHVGLYCEEIWKNIIFFCQLVREEIVPLLEDVCNQLDIQMEESQTGQAAILAASNENGGDSATLEEVVDQGYDQNQVGKSYGFRKPHKTRIHNSYCSPSS